MLKMPHPTLTESHTVFPAQTVWAFPHECLDAANATKLELELRSRLANGSLVLDLAEVRFADSSGLAVLVRCNSRSNGRLRLVNVHPSLVRCLARVTPDKLPPVMTTEETDSSHIRLVPHPSAG